MNIVRCFLFVLCFVAQNVHALVADRLQYPTEPSLYVPGSYGNRYFFAGQDHLGEDINLPEGYPIRAIGNGKIVVYRPSDGYGELAVVIEHDLGREYAFINAYGKIVVTRKALSIYGHLRNKKNRGGLDLLSWHEGMEVKIGEIIGFVNDDAHNGDGAEHLHFGIRLSGQSVAEQADYGSWFRGYERSTDQGKYFASADAVIQIVQDGGIRSLCSSVSPERAICWTPSSPSDVTCRQAKSWVLYVSFSTIVKVTTSGYCPGSETVFSYYGGDSMTSSLGGGGVGGNSADSFNLKINDFWVKDLALGYTLISEGHTVRTGQSLEARIQLKAVNGDTHDHMRAGKDRIEVDIYVREDLGDWRFLKREYTKATNLPNGATHTEHAGYTVPAGISQISFKAKIDAEDEVTEANEGDNWSRIQTFTVNNTPTYDLTVTVIQVSTPQPVMVDSSMGTKMAIRNIGTAVPMVTSRHKYEMRGPSTNSLWMQIADDGTDPGDLIPGRDQWEETKALVRSPTMPGLYELRGCADYYNTVTETDETNNCLTTTFTVVPRPDVRPNFVVSAFGLREGTTIQKGTRVHPWCTVQNVGGASPGAIQLAYYINADVFRDNDTVEASELCAGCSKTEEVKNNNIKLGDKGTRTYRCCADYQGAIAESNEGDNCSTMSFKVR